MLMPSLRSLRLFKIIAVDFLNAVRVFLGDTNTAIDHKLREPMSIDENDLLCEVFCVRRASAVNSTVVMKTPLFDCCPASAPTKL